MARSRFFITKLFLAALLALSAVILLTSRVFAEGETGEAPSPAAEAEPAAPTESEPAEALMPTEASDEETPVDLQPVDDSAAAAPEIEPPEIVTETSGDEVMPADMPQADEPTAAPAESDQYEALPVEPAAESTPVVEAPAQETAGESPDLEIIQPTGDEECPATEEGEVVETQAGSDSDPWWKVGAKTYRVLRSGCPAGELGSTCFHSSTPISYAIYLISSSGAPAPSDGILHVESTLSPYSDAFILDGSDAQIAKVKKLMGEKTNPTDPYPTLLGNFTVQNYTAGFSMIGFILNGNIAGAQATFNNNAGALLLQDLEVTNNHASGNGIRIDNHSGSITLLNVKSNNNGVTGATLDNSDGAGNVNLVNCSFNDNGDPGMGDGISIVSRGVVSLTSVSASDNYYYGAFINAKSLIVKNSTFNNNSANGYGIYFRSNNPGGVWLRGSASLENVTAINNKQDGIYVLVNGSAAFNGVNASYNQENGLQVNNCNYTSTCAFAPASITIRNSQFNNNAQIDGFNGLLVYSSGAITLSNITAANNGNPSLFAEGNGANLINAYTTGYTVNVSASNFHHNFGDGLFIESGGAVTLRDLYACHNQAADSGSGHGLYVDNRFGAKGVTLTSSSGMWNRFNENEHLTGSVRILSKGSITLNNIEANDNVLSNSGVWLDNTSGSGAVAVYGGSFNRNQYAGLRVLTNGAITVRLTDQFITQNGYFGLYLDNTYDSAASNITVEGGTFSKNDETGIYILSNGVVTVRNTALIESKYHGLNINNSYGVGSVLVECTRSGWTCTFQDSIISHGIKIISNGSVTLRKLQVNNNKSNGILVNNYNAGSGTGGISLSSITANNNGADGINLTSNGSVSLTSTTALCNGEDGVSYGRGTYIKNDHATAPAGKTVRISSSTFNENVGGGLIILSKGAINLNGVTALGNVTHTLNGDGANFDNSAGLAVSGVYPTVTITNSRFNQNEYSGVTVVSRGAITLSSVEAINNANVGLSLDNTASSTTPTLTRPAVKVTGSSIRSEIRGNLINLYIDTYGAVTLSNLSVTHSTSGVGASIDNRDDVTPASMNVSITNSLFNSNTAHGLYVLSYGAISLRSMEADYNGWSGITLNNETAPASVGITITGKSGRSSVSHNLNGGLNIRTCGRLVISNILALDNGGEGVYVINTHSSSPQTNSLSNIYSAYNYDSGGDGYGLRLVIEGNLTLSSITLLHNSQYGAFISSDAGNMTLSGSSNTISGNTSGGLWLMSVGSVNLSNLTAENNGGYGVLLNNSGASAGAGTVTLSGIRTGYNTLSGLSINAKGTARLTRIVSLGNAVSGIYISDAGYNIYISYGAFHGNGSYGIQVAAGSLVLPMPYTYYYGNQTDLTY